MKCTKANSQMYTNYLELVEKLTHTTNKKLYFHHEDSPSQQFEVLKQLCLNWLVILEPSLISENQLIIDFYNKQLKAMKVYKHKSAHKAYAYICLDKLYDDMLILALLHRDELSPYLTY